MKGVFLTFVVLIILSTAISGIGIPQLVNYQGQLTDNTGKPVVDALYFIKFKIYGSATGTDSVWSTGFQPVQVTNGLFTYQLGSTVPLPDAIFTNDTARYLGITVGADNELTMRTKLSSIAYAYQSLRADSADFALSISDGVVTTPKLIDEAVTSAKIAEGTIQFSDIGQNFATLGQILKWNGSAWVADNDSAGSSSNWTVLDSVLYTNEFLGIARGGAENVIFGNSSHTAVNLGIACTTGTETFSQAYATIGGGYQNKVIRWASTVSGGFRNIAGGSSGESCTVSGGRTNTATGESSVISGGDSNDANNDFCTVSGGHSNTASGTESTVGGGDNNTASANSSTVGGGAENTASGIRSTIGGGWNNTASGTCSFVAGGCNNSALADYSFASGSGAIAQHEGSFVWADASGIALKSTVPNQFLIRASGGTKIYSNTDLTAGVTIPAGSSAWAVNSDKNLKENFSMVNGGVLLEKIAKLPLMEWNYISQNDDIRHLGPMAQEFYALFGLGDDSVTISTIDPAGVALAGIKELIKENRKLKKTIDELKRDISEIKNH